MIEGFFVELTACAGDGIKHIAIGEWDAEYELTLCGERVYFSDYEFSGNDAICEGCQSKLVDTFVDAAISAE